MSNDEITRKAYQNMIKYDTIFDKAKKLVHGDRREQYGPPGPMYEHIAKMWNAYLGTQIEPVQVPYMMVLFKMCRESYKSKPDNNIDMIGYIGIAEEIEERPCNLVEDHPIRIHLDKAKENVTRLYAYIELLSETEKEIMLERLKRDLGLEDD